MASEVKIARGGFAIWGPEGTKLTSGTELFREGESSIYGPVTLPRTGTYTILVQPEGADAGSVKVSAYSVVNQTGSLTPTEAGASVAVSLATPGQEGRFSIAGTAGKTIGLSTSSASFTGGWRLEWVSPEGHVVASQAEGASSNAVLHRLTFATTGTYTAVVKPEGVATGSTTLTAVADVVEPLTPTEAGESKTIKLGVPGQNGELTFSGTKGESVSVVASEVKIARGGFAIWGPEGKLPGGEEVFREGEASIYGPVTLPATGSYTIWLEPEIFDTGTLKVSAYKVVNQTGSLTPTEAGASIAVSLSTPGQEGRFEVSGTAGKTIGLSTSSASFTGGWRLEWLNPEGHVVASQSEGASSNGVLHRLTFATTGTYTAVVKPEGAATGVRDPDRRGRRRRSDFADRSGRIQDDQTRGRRSGRRADVLGQRRRKRDRDDLRSENRTGWFRGLGSRRETPGRGNSLPGRRIQRLRAGDAPENRRLYASGWNPNSSTPGRSR